jgi:hypothetical protein
MYQLKLPASYKALHPVFSVDRLSLWKGNEVNGTQPPPPKAVHFKDQTEPEYLDLKARGKGLSYLVQWKGYDKSHDQWISCTELMCHALDAVANFHLRKPGAPQMVKASVFDHMLWWPISVSYHYTEPIVNNLLERAPQVSSLGCRTLGRG